jgi:hypothetical protein
MLQQFDHASEELLRARALQQRVDRKYVLPIETLEPLLAPLRSDFRVVKSGGQAIARYETVYFDTPELQLYHAHRRGRRPRFKIRIRHHLDRRRTYLEVKRKTQGNTTVKVRIELRFGQSDLDPAARRFIDAHCPVDASRLVPWLSVVFRRITLVSAAVDERLTLDSDLLFAGESCSERLTGVAIAEIKQARDAAASGAAAVFRSLHIREQPFSKYCVGIARVAPVRRNTFKPAFRSVEQVRGCWSS